MNTLQVNFPDVWRGWDIKQCVLDSAIDSSSDTNSSGSDDSSAPERAVAVVDPKALTDCWSDTPVFRGHLYQPRRPWERVNVALKFAMRGDLIGDLIAEAEMYLGPLARLQGSTVPRFYGLYIGSHEDREIACIVLEYCGDVLQKPFRQLPIDMRIRILQCLGEIHRQGFLHGDFAERNILLRNGDIRIIDFDQSVGGHRCGCDMKFSPGQIPDPKMFGCEHLWRISRNVMRIWS